ncbi:MAG: cation transporter, partial [Desulfovibrio sp.]|nr:cation transporter [Desulfovibrio sp.]
MSGAMGLRPCGARDPEGNVCEKGDALRARQAAEAACGPARQRDGRTGGGAFSDGPGVGKDDAAHPAASGETPACGCGCRAEHASGSAAVSVDYRIPAMDCPAEEALIRRKLATVPGIESLECNLMRRVLTVRHRLPSTEVVESALREIGMPPETADADRDRVTVFIIEGMDCPVEERLVRDKLAGMPGVVSLEFNLLRRTLRVAHAPAALPAVAAALDSLGMGARMLAPDAASVPAAPRIPWARLAVAGVFAALAEALDLLLHWQSGLWGEASVLHSLLRVAMPAASVAAIAFSGLT